MAGSAEADGDSILSLGVKVSCEAASSVLLLVLEFCRVDVEGVKSSEIDGAHASAC